MRILRADGTARFHVMGKTQATTTTAAPATVGVYRRLRMRLSFDQAKRRFFTERKEVVKKLAE